MTTLKRWVTGNKLLILAITVSYLMMIFALSPDLWDKYRIVHDVQNSYWMARYQDPTLFPQDYLWSRQLLDVNILGLHLVLYPLSLGWGLIFYPASFIIDHIWLSKLLVFALMPVCIIYLFKLGEQIGNRLTGLSLSLLFAFFILASPQSISPASGLQRGFAVPILIMFIYYLVNKQYGPAGVMTFINTLIYVPNFFLTALAYTLSLFNLRPPFNFFQNLTRTTLIPLIFGICLSASTIGLIFAVQFGVITSSSTAVGEGATAYDPMYLSFPWLGRAGIFDTGADALNFLVLVIFSVLIYKVVGRDSLKQVPVAVWSLLIAGVFMFFLALSLIFQSWIPFNLYYPSRYTRSVLFVVPLLFVGLNWSIFVEKAPAWFRQRAPLLIFFNVSLFLALGAIYFFAPAQLPLLPLMLFLGLIAAGLVVLLAWTALCHLLLRPGAKRQTAAIVGLSLLIISVGGVYIKVLGLKTSNPTQDARRVYEFVAALPKDVLIAGDPELMDDIPLFSKRSVLFNTLNPGGSDAAILDFFNAQYAETPQPIFDFCQDYHVDYLVLDEQTFTPAYITKGEFYHQPHNDKIVTLMSDRSNFVLLERQPVFASGPYRVIKCDINMTTELRN